MIFKRLFKRNKLLSWLNLQSNCKKVKAQNMVSNKYDYQIPITGDSQVINEINKNEFWKRIF